ncbi:MAG: SDR family oxidoreductase [Acidobacteria bacterium]|nr:SDR family oxidoreductase [Acidobacteriota bacterium]
MGALRPLAFFARNAQSFSERWTRLIGLALLALGWPFFLVIHRVLAIRLLHTMLRGMSRDRLDLLGEEYFHYALKPRLRQKAVEKLKQCMAEEKPVVLLSQSLEHVVRPLAIYLGVKHILANRLDFRDGLATGRLLDPVVPPKLPLPSGNVWGADGQVSEDRLSRKLHSQQSLSHWKNAIVSSHRQHPHPARPIVLFDSQERPAPLSIRETLSGKQILLIGVTGFIGKVWLVHLFRDLPEVGKIYVLIRRHGAHTALRRFEKIVAESPLFDSFHESYGTRLAEFLREKVEVVEGDVSQAGVGLEPEILRRLCQNLDLVVNSSGLTDFNPDLREALATNVDAVAHLLDFLRQTDHAALLHLSTCYAVGTCDGRVSEEPAPNYTPARVAGFDAEQERRSLQELVRRVEARAHSPLLTEEFRRHALEKSPAGKSLSGSTLEKQIWKQRSRWVRNHLTRAGLRRARELGWPNTYTFTKSLAESLIQRLGSDLPISVVRPSIVESSIEQPFRGWIEGVNTSAPLSYLLGTYFRQLPSNQRKCLDVIPVDLVCRGMTLIAAALVQRRHEKLYQLATSASNPCNMRRSIELTCLAHRKYYRTQDGLEHWLRSRFDTISVSKERYQKFSAPRQKALVRALQRTTPPLPFLRPPLARTERNLDRVEKIIELYEPFILHNDHVFEAENIEKLSQALVPQERETFGYDVRSIDWWDYWINVHIPAQRRWSYPLLEGRPLEPRPPRTFHLGEAPATTLTESNGLDNDNARPIATWPSS